MADNKLTAADNKRIYDYKYQYPRTDIEYFKKNILPIMEKLRPKYTSDDVYFSAIMKEMSAKGLTLNENTGNMVVDRMAVDRIPKGAWDYIKTQAGENFSYKVISDIIRAGSDFVRGNDNDSPLEAEIKNRARAFYNPGTWESLGAISATTLVNAVAEAPLTLITMGQSVAYDAALVGINELADRVGSNVTRDLEHRKAFIHSLAEHYAAEEQKYKTNVPSWMLKQGLNGKTYETASDKQLQAAREWSEKQASLWLKRYNMVKDRTPDENGYTFRDRQSGKLYTTTEVLKKYQEYKRFSIECLEVIGSRRSHREIQKAESERQQIQNSHLEAEGNGTQVLLDDIDGTMYGKGSNNKTASTENDSQKQLEADPWGTMLAQWKKQSGFESFMKNPGSTIASIPDVIMSLMSGKLPFNSDMLMPLACIAGGLFSNNALLKIPLVLGGSASLAGKVAQGGKGETEQPRYKKYADQELNPRISDPRIQGNTLMLDVDHVPYIVSISNNAAEAYKAGTLPINVIANSVLDKMSNANAPVVQQSNDAVKVVEQNREQSVRIK